MANWQDEFHERYTSPRVENVTVGFSGIDPNSRANSNITDEYITNLTLQYLSSLPISIDSGDITPGAAPPEVQPVTLKPSEIPHEMLDGLLGGNTSEHYHLTLDEWTKLLKVLAVLFTNGATEPQSLSALSNPDALNTIIDTRIQEYLRAHTPEAEINTDTLEELIQEYLTANPPEGTINTEALNSSIDARIAAYMAEHPIEQPTIDTEALNTAIDARIEQYFEENPIETEIDANTISTMIDTRIQQYLQTLNGGEVTEPDSDNP